MMRYRLARDSAAVTARGIARLSPTMSVAAMFAGAADGGAKARHRRLHGCCVAPRRGYALTCLVMAIITACGSVEPVGYQGYAEGEFVRVAVPFAGRLDTLLVQRGQTVAADTPLFILEQDNEAAARRGAEQRLRAAEALLADLEKGKRPVELNVVKAQLAQAIAAERLAAIQLQRDERLAKQNFVSRDQLDTSRTAHQRGVERVNELRNQLKSAELASRADLIRAQAAEVDAARAALAQSEWQLAQKNATTAQAGLVFDTFYVAGEWVPAGNPVVSILPPTNIKVRFFVPEGVVGGFRPGQSVVIHCDGCGEPIPASVRYISPQPEFTPPVIYSNETRAKLVFMLEARPLLAEASRLHPGQPVDVRLR